MTAATGWKPKVGVREGVAKLYAWLRGSAAPRPGVVASAPPPGKAAWRTSKEEVARAQHRRSKEAI